MRQAISLSYAKEPLLIMKVRATKKGKGIVRVA